MFQEVKLCSVPWFAYLPVSKDTSFPGWFRKHGYTTVSVGKVSHHPGGRGGRDWDEDDKPEMPGAWTRHLLPAGPWQHPRGAMHGLANGEIRKNAKDMDVYQAFDGPDSVYPDGLITDEALKQMDTLAKTDKPFFLAVGIIRPHLPFGTPAKYMKHYKNAKLPVTPSKEAHWQNYVARLGRDHEIHPLEAQSEYGCRVRP